MTELLRSVVERAEPAPQISKALPLGTKFLRANGPLADMGIDISIDLHGFVNSRWPPRKYRSFEDEQIPLLFFVDRAVIAQWSHVVACLDADVGTMHNEGWWISRYSKNLPTIPANFRPERLFLAYADYSIEQMQELQSLEANGKPDDHYVPDSRVLANLGRLVLHREEDEFSKRMASYDKQDPTSRSLLAASLSTVVYSVIGQMADNSLVENGEIEIDISDGRSFSIAFEHALLRSLPIRPSESSVFITSLHDDLFKFLSFRKHMDGPWGRVDLLEGGRLVAVPRSEAHSYFESL